jgi:hypothetical protein
MAGAARHHISLSDWAPAFAGEEVRFWVNAHGFGQVLRDALALELPNMRPKHSDTLVDWNFRLLGPE